MSQQRHEIIQGAPLADPVPSGLSEWAIRTWTALTARHTCEAHELITFGRALRWWDRSDAAAARADMRLAIDCASAALRHWRVLKFPAPAGVRRPGRQPGAEWNAERRA